MTQLRLITESEQVPQLYDPEAEPVYPVSLTQLTDDLHDQGLEDLGLMVLDQYTKLERLIAFSRFILLGDEPK